ncbi:MAG: (d)CMP kinase [Actinomycetota bacterium]|nr:(d)CMP kinase [Actinomycetota bacterium]
MSPSPRVVAIDGAAGSGKSTLARSLAAALGLPYVNTGLMYRALAAAALREATPPDDDQALVRLARGLRFIVRVEPPGELEVEGYDSSELTSVEVESTVSVVASHDVVRAYMRREQRELGNRHGAVMEGRDIASVVFTDAPVKLYLQAPADLRAHRRAIERSSGQGSDVAAALGRRDERDARTTPHEPAPGAVVIDTSELDPQRTLAVAIEAVRELAPEMLGSGPTASGTST